MPAPETKNQKKVRSGIYDQIEAALGGLPTPGGMLSTGLAPFSRRADQLPPACFHHGGDASPDGRWKLVPGGYQSGKVWSKCADACHLKVGSGNRSALPKIFFIAIYPSDDVG